MASPSFPPSSYGDRPPLQGYRRSFTVPARQLSVHERAGLDKSDADADVLFTHPSARIIAFSPPTDSIQQTQSKETLPDADYPIDAVETLPWRSRTETLASTGLIKIEKVRGSSYFLKSADQKVIHSIMRNSQCWCVDGESKFVLRRAKFKYYRVELPSETEEDKQKVAEFKVALGKVLRFERTPCPFKRAFHVDLPDDAITPRRKGTWKRRQPLQPTTPNTDPLPLRRTKDSRTWSFQAQNDSSPLQRYGRRGSDYGFSTSRGSSGSRPGPNEYRSSTPSSVISSEDAYDRRHEDGYSEDGLPEDEPVDAQQADGISTNGSEAEQSSASDEQKQENDIPPPTKDAHADNEVDASSTQIAETLIPETEEIPTVEATAPSIEPPEIDSDARVAEEVDVAEQVPQEADEPSADVSPAVEQPEEQPEVQPDSNMDIETEHSTLEAPAEPNVDTDSTAHVDEEPDSLVSSTVEASVNDGSVEPANDTPSEQALSQLHQEGAEAEEEGLPEQADDALSRVSSVDSFHTTDSLNEDIADEQVRAIDFQQAQDTEGFTPFFLNRSNHQRGLSELTITASTIASEQSPQKPRPSTSDSTPGLARSSTSDSSWPEVHTPPASPINENLRRRLQAKRSFSPLPPSATLYTPTPSPANHGSPFTAQFLQKAANVALVKPIEAVALLVHILARIAGGATLNDLFSGDLFRRPGDREPGVHRRRTSFPDQPALPRDDSEDEDDFGVPIRGRTRSAESAPSRTQATTTARESASQDDHDSIFDLD